MANTFELISSYTASGSVASIGFSSIPSTYTDLCIKLSLRSSNTAGTYDPLQIHLEIWKFIFLIMQMLHTQTQCLQMEFQRLMVLVQFLC